MNGSRARQCWFSYFSVDFMVCRCSSATNWRPCQNLPPLVLVPKDGIRSVFLKPRRLWIYAAPNRQLLVCTRVAYSTNVIGNPWKKKKCFRINSLPELRFNRIGGRLVAVRFRVLIYFIFFFVFYLFASSHLVFDVHSRISERAK